MGQGSRRVAPRFRVRASADRALLDECMSNWSDLMTFDVQPVLSSNEVVACMAPGNGG